MGSTTSKLLAALAAVVLVGLAWLGQRHGFHTLQQMRQLERVPRGAAVSVLEGEVNLAGVARSAGGTVGATHTGTPCFYFRYVKEREERDSDGDTRWVVVDRVERQVPFYLEDDSGRVLVTPSAPARFNLRRDHRSKRGDFRYTEWRLDPGDDFFVFGYARSEGDGHVVTFDQPGSYTAIVSQLGEQGERSRMATRSLGASFLALLAVSFAVVFACWALGVHRIMAFLVLLAVVEGGALTSMGLRLLEDDLGDSERRVKVQVERSSAEIAGILGRAGIHWSSDWGDRDVFGGGLAAGLEPRSFERVRRIYADVAAAASRHNQVLARFPERLLAPLFGLGPVEELPLAADFPARVAIEEAPVGTLPVVLALATGIAFALGGSALGFRAVRQKRSIENIPTSRSAGLAYGPAEIQGAVEPLGETLSGPLSGLACVYYHYTVQERRGSGKNQRWETITDRVEHRPFQCRDDEGVTPVDLTHAEVHSVNRHHRREGKRQYSEWNLRPEETVYVLGSAVVEPSSGDRLQMAAGDGEFSFLVANLSETELMMKKARRGLLWLNSGLNGLVLAAVALLGATASYAATDYLSAALVAPAFLSVCFVVLMYNDLQFVRHRVARAWSNIGVSLRKRTDLIPNLEAVAKQYLAHEKELLAELAELRRDYAADRSLDPETAGPLVEREARTADRLIGVVERYPDLEGSEVLAALSDQLVRMENEIALMRQGYNDSVERYNTRIGQLPELLLARLFGFRESPLLHASIEVRRAAPPRV